MSSAKTSHHKTKIEPGEARSNIKNPVLVVVDMQQGFLNAHSENVLPRVADIVQECMRQKITTVFTKFINFRNSPFERLLDWSNVRESPETDLHETLAPFVEVIIQKHYYTAFTPEFERLTESAGWDTILICGVSTESCVLKTALDAFERYIRPIVISDACASDQGIEVHETGLDILETTIGKRQIMTTDEVFAALDIEKKY